MQDFVHQQYHAISDCSSASFLDKPCFGPSRRCCQMLTLQHVTMTVLFGLSRNCGATWNHTLVWYLWIGKHNKTSSGVCWKQSHTWRSTPFDTKNDARCNQQPLESFNCSKKPGCLQVLPTEYVILMMGKKSCTKWDVLNPVIDGQFTTSTGAGILLSTVYCFVQPCPSPSINFVVPQFWGSCVFWIKDWTKLCSVSAPSFLKSGLKPIFAACCLLKRHSTYLLACLLACWLAGLLTYLLTYLLFPNGILTKKGKPFKWMMGQCLIILNQG